MKKLILFFLATTSLMYKSYSQGQRFVSDSVSTPHVCNCILADHHDIDFNHAEELIRRFKRKLKVDSYGGTIYGDEAYFDEIGGPSRKGWPLKYHFCTDGSQSRNLFLAFEKDSCRPAVYADASGMVMIANDADIPNDCIQSSDVYFDKIENKIHIQIFNSRTFTDQLQNDARRRNNVTQNVDAVSVKNAKDSLNVNQYFLNHLHNSLHIGNFNFENSIHQLFLNGDTTTTGTACAGIRYYFGYDNCREARMSPNGNQIRVILVGVDAQGNNLRIWKENSVPTYY